MNRQLRTPSPTTPQPKAPVPVEATKQQKPAA